jgi:hypothetical protein
MARKAGTRKKAKSSKVWKTVSVIPTDAEIFDRIVDKTGKKKYVIFREMLDVYKNTYPEVCAGIL